MTDNSPETELLRWLMQCHGSQYLAAPGVPRPDLLPSWAQGVGMEEFEIDYEPRCLAVTHGPRVMVGTKAGSIYLVIWDDEKSRWRMDREWKGGRDYETSPLRAIRAITMLDDQTLVAGLDAGSFLVCSLGATKEKDQIRKVPESGPEEDRSWLNRYSRLIRLHPYNETPEKGDLVLGLSLGAQVHLLERQEDGYKVSSKAPEDIDFLTWKGDWGRVLDATWSCDCLWLLSSRGFLLRYHRDEKGALCFDAEQGPLPLKYQRRGGAFRGLSSCIMGLSVLASDHVAFLRYRFENGTTPRVDPKEIHWFSMPDAIDGTVCLPYHPQPGSSQVPEKYLEDSENPVWTVATTGKHQLYWVAWPDFPRGRTNSWLPWRAPALFTNVGKGALYSRFGWPRSGSPPFLVVGTRDHKLRIVSVLNRKQCEETIKSMVASRDCSKIPGAELWNLQQWIKSDFTSLRLTSEQEWAASRQLLGGTTEDNLRTLVVIVHRAWEAAPKGTEEEQQAAKNLLTDWMLRLLQRAYEFRPELARDLAQSAYGRIAARRGNESIGVERWKQLGLFAGFLRKWILRGSTYEEKPAHLRQLYEWNRDCKRHLDALAYLTRLFRRRVDPEWTVVLSEGGSAPAVWDVAACPPGSSPESPFAITSFTDGSLSVFSSKGRRLPWRMAPSRTIADLNSELLEIDPQGHRLRHRDAREFIEKYRHGPYARSLLLLRQGTADSGNEDSYLLFFPLRGWRSQDRDWEDRKPRVCALSIRPEFADQDDGEIQAVLIEGVKSVSIDEELYALCELETPDRDPGVHLILAGTSGTVKKEQSKGWIPCPFREFEIRIAASEVAITVRSAPVYLLPKGQRSLFRNTAAATGDTAYNPCWVLVCSQVSPEGARVWAGFQDGSIRGFQRRPFKEASGEAIAESGSPPPTWVERGWIAAEDGQSDGDRQTDFKVAAAVWSLHMVEHKEKRYLAYGTGDGTLGMVDLDALEGSKPREFSHLIHTREASPISTLIDYTEDNGRRLLAITQQGIVCIFSLDFGDDLERWSQAGPTSKTERSHRFVFPGLRLDHFSLRHSARAIVRMDNPFSKAGEGLRLLVGSVEGSIHQHHLRYPRKSSRRKDAREELLKLMPGNAHGLQAAGSGDQSELVDAVGRENALAWLRVLDLNDLNLVKFSLWRDLLGRDPGTTYPPDRDEVKRYIEHLHHLADEVYGRRPFSSEPAKVLWEVTGRFANQILRKALQEKGPAFGACLDAHRDLAVAIDDLCNRWIGFHQSFEAKVLIHSFEAFFDWTHIVLLAGRHEEAEKVDSLRTFLLNKTVQRRLYHSDSIVALEMLRILNDSMIRAIAHARPQQEGQAPLWTFGLREGKDMGFYDLMTMVGDLGERLKESLTPANPFSTEIIRFFALSLLLVPDSALIIGQVVSESRLTERGNGLAKAVILQAEEIAKHLKIGDDESLDRAIHRFDSYCSTEARLDLLDHWPDSEIQADEESPWLFLLKEALRSGSGETPSDEEFLGELKHVLVAASWLSRLDERPGARQLPADSHEENPQNRAYHIQEQRDKAIEEALEWLEQPEESFHYFKHSASYLKRLKEIREDVCDLSGLTGKNPSIKRAMARCEDELKRIDDTDLFQPQRTHFKGVIRSWYEYLVRRAEDALRVLDIIDEFNRHVYRTSADNLMTTLTELAMQVAPFSYLERPEEGPWRVTHEGPVRRLIHKRLEGNTLIREVFERGDRLVDYTHLSGTLLEVARDHLGRGALVSRRIDDQVTGAEVREEIERERDARGLTLVDGQGDWWGGIGTSSLPKIPIPGTRATWNAIIQEYARNISRYCHDLTNEEGTSTFFKAAVHEDCVLLSGSVPFLDSLPLDFMRKEIHDAQGKVDIKKVNRVIASLWEPRRKIHDQEMSSSSGMGLYLIKELSALCGLDLKLILFDPTESLAECDQGKEEKEKLWPLCLKVTWKRQSQTL